MKVIKSIKYVNKVIVFDETNPLKVIKKIKPDIIFKGSDYKLKNIIGYNFQMKRKKKIETIKLVGNISTTKIIKKL